MLWKGQEFASIFDAICDAAAQSRVQVRWIIDAENGFRFAFALRQ